MRRAVFTILVVPLGLCITPYSSESEQLPACLMEPVHISIPLPDFGLTRTTFPGDEFDEPCEDVPVNEWALRSSSQGTLFVNADGPAGSGRYWNVIVGLGGEGLTAPRRGVCLETSTVGWRTLQRYKTPLEWNTDLNGDGEPELVLWSSFPLSGSGTAGEFGVVGWVYRLDAGAVLSIDWGLSRTLALDIARSYRSDLNQGERLKDLRSRAAQALEDFNRGMCTVG